MKKKQLVMPVSQIKVFLVINVFSLSHLKLVMIPCANDEKASKRGVNCSHTGSH